MELWKPILFLLSGIGVINGIILSFILLFTKNRQLKDVLFGGLILMLCIRIGKSIYFYYTEDIDKLILQIGLSACVFIGPLFYLYIKTEKSQFQNLSLPHRSLLGLIGIGIIGVGLIYPYRIYPEIWNNIIIRVIYFIWTSFVLLALIEIRGILKIFFTKKSSLTSSDKKLLVITAGMVFITFCYQFAYWVKGFTYLWGSLIFTSVFYYLFYKEITLLLQKQKNKKATKSSELTNGTALLQQVEQIMKLEQPHKKSTLKLKDLATITNINSHQLSRVLNEVYPHGFATYINEKRVEEAKKLIQSNSNFTLEGIGYEAGFNSKSSFYASFKKLTGQTPAEYKKQYK